MASLKDERQIKFVEEYIKSLNATDAAIKAGYSEKTARSQGSRLLTNVDIQEAIQKAKIERQERANIDADYVLKRLVEIDQMDVLDIMDDQMKILPLRDWPKIWRQYISNIENLELTDADGVFKKIKWPDKVKNLELLGKHVSVGAFKEQLKIGGDPDNPINMSLKVVFEDDGETSTK
jgi:phage terminase small subunit